jgi:thioredoxin-related protein
MKKLFLAFVLLIGITSSAQVLSAKNLKEAKTIASQEQKDIMIVFSGSDWCVPCMRLDKEILSQPGFENYAAKKMVLIKADFPLRAKNKKLISKDQKAYNAKLFEKYNPKGIFPFVVILNNKGEEIAETSYKKMSPESYASYIDNLISSK